MPEARCALSGITRERETDKQKREGKYRVYISVGSSVFCVISIANLTKQHAESRSKTATLLNITLYLVLSPGYMLDISYFSGRSI